MTQRAHESGAHRVHPLHGRESDALPIERESIDREMRHRRKERYEIMRVIRDGLRTGLIDGFFIPDATLSQIYDEDIDFHARTMLRDAQRKGKPIDVDGDIDMFKYRAAHDPLQLTRAEMEHAQYARYMGAKMKKLLREKDLVGARTIFDEARSHTNGDAVKAVDDVCTLHVIDAINESYFSRDYYCIVDILMEFGDTGLMNFMPADFEDFLPEALKDERFLYAIWQKVSGFMYTRREYYPAIKKYFENLGFKISSTFKTPEAEGNVFVSGDDDDDLPPAS